MNHYFQKTISAAPLAVFRIVLGLLLFASIVRFWAKGWIYELYIQPKYFFSFYGLEFVKPFGHYTYFLFAICAISALFFAFGLFYRVASVVLFLSFTYIELMDKSAYLNHYYFISMICMMMIFLPANCFFSFDSLRNKKLLADRVPRWTVDSIKIFVCIVYVFAGLAKINSDWLLHARPLQIWLPSKNNLPIIGTLFNYIWIAYAFSWIGCIYDLTVSFLLWNKTTRIFAYVSVIIFHVLTAMLFPIGMFPYVMMATALIFFSDAFHLKIIRKIGLLIKAPDHFLKTDRIYSYPNFTSKVLITLFVIFFSVQLVMPFRYLLYPGELFWTEEGYRFSWRVMLMEKAGNAQFIIDSTNGKHTMVDNSMFLTKLQEKMMATQPDMILQYAHMLRDHYADEGWSSPQVYVDSYVTLNGRLGKPLIDPHTDLAKESESFKHKSWIIPIENEIKGF